MAPQYTCSPIPFSRQHIYQAHENQQPGYAYLVRGTRFHYGMNLLCPWIQQFALIQDQCKVAMTAPTVLYCLRQCYISELKDHCSTVIHLVKLSYTSPTVSY